MIVKPVLVALPECSGNHNLLSNSYFYNSPV
jgi:hypothetical protein